MHLLVFKSVSKQRKICSGVSFKKFKKKKHKKREIDQEHDAAIPIH